MRSHLAAIALAALVAMPASADAQRMFARTPSQYSGYGYGNFNWTEFTGMWDARFGAGNIDEGAAITSLDGYTSLYLDANQPFSGAFNLSEAERTEILDFVAGGGRLYAFGENDNWASWNSSVLSLFGASASGFGADGGTPLVSNVLTQGVTSIDTPAPGFITDFGTTGTSLFSNGFAGTFGAASNALVVLDINICDDGNIERADNRQFCENIVNYTAGAPINPVPEPSAIVLLSLGALGMVRARRNRA